MDRKVKQIINKFILILMLFGLIMYFISLGNPYQLSNDFKGTYESIGERSRGWIAISQDEEFFYYTDTASKTHIMGNIKKIRQNVYYITCASEENRSIIENQEIMVNKKVITLKINGKKMTFKKSDEGTVLEDNYPYL